MDILEINSLNEYIEIIKKNKLNDCYFRGENTKYSNIVSSLLRKSETSLLKEGGYKFNEKVINEYYEEIATNITEFDRKNFLAFSQHHGLPTNLIDLTTAPLIALYFACSKDVYSETDKGYVYLIKKDNTIDVSELINKYFIPPKRNYNLIEMFRCNEQEVIKELVGYLESFFWVNGFEPYRTNVANQVGVLANKPVGNILRFYYKYAEAMNDPNLLVNADIFYELLFEKSEIGLKLGQCSNLNGICKFTL